jgi:hypothetical protein
MQTGTPTNAKITALLEEMHSIHVANSLYWKQPKQDQTREARAEYQRRQDRLEEIRSELSQLSST